MLHESVFSPNQWNVQNNSLLKTEIINQEETMLERLGKIELDCEWPT